MTTCRARDDGSFTPLHQGPICFMSLAGDGTMPVITANSFASGSMMGALVESDFEKARRSFTSQMRASNFEATTTLLRLLMQGDGSKPLFTCGPAMGGFKLQQLTWLAALPMSYC